jgi:hypothetical protein
MRTRHFTGLHDGTAEEQLLRMEMTELQRSLSEAHGEASSARETADKVLNSLQEAQARHKHVCVCYWRAVDLYVTCAVGQMTVQWL